MDSIHAGSISQPPDQWRDPMCISRVSRSESPHCGCLTCATETVYDGRVMKTALDRASSLLIFLLLLAGLGILPTAAQSRTTPNAQLASKEVNARVDALVKQMTLDEKIGQLVSYSAGFATGPAASNLTYDELVAKGQVGSMLNVVGAEKTNHYQHIAMEKSRLHIPLLFGLDVIHGHRTTFPIPLAVAASWDTDAAETVARTGATEARAGRGRLGLLADGGYRTRSALGAHRRVKRGRPLPQFGDGARVGQGLSAG